MLREIKDIFNQNSNKTKDEFEDLYKWKKVPYKKDDLYLLNKLLQEKSKKKQNNRGLFGGGKSLSTINKKDQRVTFKMSYNSFLNVHKDYLRTYMPQENKNEVTEKPKLFGSPFEEYEENMVGKHYKCIISPENQNVNLELLCNEFIRHIETMTGFKLYWQGCIHNDTAHRHAHICINGKDKNGREVYFQPEMIRRTMRETLSYLTTKMMGERSEREILVEQKNLIKAKRWTSLDSQIEKYPTRIPIRLVNPEIQNRLSFLYEVGLANKNEKYYSINPEYKNILTATGRYNTFLSEYIKFNGNLELYSGGKIRGKVIDVINFDKDESWNDALIISKGEKNIYVPIWQLKKNNLMGATVEIEGGTRSLSRQIKDSSIKIIEKSKFNKNERV